MQTGPGAVVSNDYNSAAAWRMDIAFESRTGTAIRSCLAKLAPERAADTCERRNRNNVDAEPAPPSYRNRHSVRCRLWRSLFAGAFRATVATRNERLHFTQ